MKHIMKGLTTISTMTTYEVMIRYLRALSCMTFEKPFCSMTKHSDLRVILSLAHGVTLRDPDLWPTSRNRDVGFTPRSRLRTYPILHFALSTYSMLVIGFPHCWQPNRQERNERRGMVRTSHTEMQSELKAKYEDIPQ